ncbi:hypothetical protein [Amycolatopsis sp. NPDC052450]|uniref:hypothetical protein n=1 Tax=Amycolatopsis sp. NPDC052450 TaxID=3363937 RepID=UPI0037CC233C
MSAPPPPIARPSWPPPARKSRPAVGCSSKGIRRLELLALHATLAEAGLVFERWCTGDRTWFAAVPA